MAPRKIALLTDSCADLSPQLAEENRIHMVPLRIRCADGEYRDGVDITAADIYRRLRSGELPKTSLPVGEDITAIFDKLAAEGYDGVIAVMLSGGLSGTYNMVRLLGEERKDLEVRVYDSVSGSLGGDDHAPAGGGPAGRGLLAGADPEAGAPAHQEYLPLLLGGYPGVSPEGGSHR